MRMNLLAFMVPVLLLSFAYAYGDLSSLIHETKIELKDNFSHGQIQTTLEKIAKYEKLKTEQYERVYVLDAINKDYLKLSGEIPHHGKSGLVEIMVTRPDKSSDIIHTPISETGTYSTILPLNNKFFEGTYTITTKFGNENFPPTSFYVSQNKPETIFPKWFEMNLRWWTEDKISDDNLVSSLKYMIDRNMIRIVPEKTSPDIDVLVSGEKTVRRGTTHSINILVTENQIPVDGAKVTLRIEDYGENEIRTFQGFTDMNGEFVFSWEIPKSFDDLKVLLAYISVTYGEYSQTKVFKFQVYCVPGEIGCKIDGN